MWVNRYIKERIGAETTIQNHHPGDKIARAITEIQEKAIVRVGGSECVRVEKYGANECRVVIAEGSQDAAWKVISICEDGETKQYKFAVVPI